MSHSPKRAKPRQQPTPRQEKRFLQIVTAIVAGGLLWLLLAPGSGIMVLLSKRSEQKQLELEITQLKKENIDMQQTIDRLENDPQYLEEVARKEYGLLKKNERVFDFPENRKKKEE